MDAFLILGHLVVKTGKHHCPNLNPDELLMEYLPVFSGLCHLL